MINILSWIVENAEILAEIVLFLIFVLFVLKHSLVIVPAFHYGYIIRLGRRTGRKLKEGIALKWPLIDELALESMLVRNTDVKFSAFSLDKIEIICQTRIQWKPDFDNLMRFVERKLIIGETLRNESRARGQSVNQLAFQLTQEYFAGEGLKEIIASICAGVIGVMPAKTFIDNRAQIEKAIDYMIRGEKDIPNSAMLAKILADEEKLLLPLTKEEFSEIKSDIEQMLGIEIECFNFVDVTFSEETKGALEDLIQTKARRIALQEEIAAKAAAIKELAALGIDPHQALDSAELVLNKENVKKQVTAIRGIDKVAEAIGALFKK